MFAQTKQVIFKITEGCNLRCSYCYVYGKDEHRGQILSEENFTKVLHRVFEESQFGVMLDNGEPDPESQPIELTFHGGEPLTLGKERFAKYCKIAHQLARKYTKSIAISVQTNATLIDDEWIAIFRKYKIEPGISDDGILDTSNDERDAKKLQETIFKLKKYNMIHGALMVLHKSNHKNIIQEIELLRTLGITGLKINRAVDTTTTGPSKVELNAKELFEVYKQIFFYMMSHPEIKESNVEQWMNKYIRGESRGIEGRDYGAHCYTRWCGAGNGLIEIEPDGIINFCGRNSSKGKDTIPLSSPGSFNSNDVLDLRYTKAALDFHTGKANSVVKNKCNLCYAQAICDGGCPAFSYTKYGEVKIDPTTCALNKMMYKFLVENDSLVKKYYGDEVNDLEPNSNFYL